jgi:hypothetical protein
MKKKKKKERKRERKSSFSAKIAIDMKTCAKSKELLRGFEQFSFNNFNKLPLLRE